MKAAARARLARRLTAELRAPTDRELAVLADLVDRVVEAGGDR
jgi:hypothetical protein